MSGNKWLPIAFFLGNLSKSRNYSCIVWTVLMICRTVCDKLLLDSDITFYYENVHIYIDIWNK